jgi:hypothetical protein
MNRIALLLSLLLLPLAIATAPVCAGGRHEGRRGSEIPQRGPQAGISAAQAAEIARGRTGGRVLAVKPGGDGYQVKVLTPNGEVRYVPVRRGGR